MNASTIPNTNDIVKLNSDALPRLIERAAAALASATTAGEVLEAKQQADIAYTAAKHAERLAVAKQAHDTIIIACRRAMADAVNIEAAAQIRLANEYDAAQDRGEVASRGGTGSNQYANVPNENISSTIESIGLTRKQVYEARIVRDAEKKQPGIVREATDAAVAAGEAPTHAYIKRAITPPKPPATPRPVAAPKSTPQPVVDPNPAIIKALKKEIWRLRDKFDQLTMYLIDKPQPNAEDRPIAKLRYWPMPEKLEPRPKDMPRILVDPPADTTADQAFALRKEEFEQWLVRRREALEMLYVAKETAMKQDFEEKIIKPRVKRAVEERMRKERLHYSPLTEGQVKTLLVALHPDTRDTATIAQKDSAARIVVAARARLAYKDKEKGSTNIPAETETPAPPTQELK